MNETSTPIALHRCRFVDYSPSPITALAFPPLPLPSRSTPKLGKERDGGRGAKFGTLVAGHANGNIDLLEWTGEVDELQAPQVWQLRKTLPGPHPSKVDSLALAIRHPDILSSDNVPSCSDLRMFSSGGGSELLEWDIARSCVRRTIGSQGGSIWSMAPNPASTMLALGCEDGCVRLLSLVADTLQHHRRFDHVKGRLLSIAWGPPVPPQVRPSSRVPGAGDDDAESDDDDDDDDDEWTDSWLVTGGSDSSLRKWNVKTGQPIDRMVTDRMKGERTLVWTVGVLADGTIVSGDSLGTVKFWDAMTCTQAHSFTAHGADVLCLAIGPEGTTVFTSGVDQKIVQFTYVPPTTSASSMLNSSVGKWIQTASRRIHSHDVRSLATWPPYTPILASYRHKSPPGSPYVAPILASGGLDMSITLMPALPAHITTSTVATRIVNPIGGNTATTFEDSYFRRLPYRSPVCIARKARLVSCMYETGLKVWRVLNIPSTDMIVDGTDITTDPVTRVGWRRVLEMELNVHTNLVASAISEDGRWLVASDLYETKLFELTASDPQSTGDVKPKRVRSLATVLQQHIPGPASKESLSIGGSTFVFTPDSKRMIMASATTSYILVVDLSSNEPTVLRRFEHHRKIGSVSGKRLIRGPSSLLENDKVDDDGDEIPDPNISPFVVKAAISPDGQWLVTSDERCRTFVFNLDSIQYHTTLPSLPQPPTTMTFIPEKPQILILVLPNNTMHAFDVENSEVPIWALDLNARIPKPFFTTSDPVVGVAFEPAPSSPPLTNGDLAMGDATQAHSEGVPSSQPAAVFWGSTWLCKLRLDWIGQHTGRRKRRKSRAQRPLPSNSDVQTSTGEARDVRIITHYRSILALDFLKTGELLMVERPLIDMLSKLPPAFFKPKYGRT